MKRGNGMIGKKVLSIGLALVMVLSIGGVVFAGMGPGCVVIIPEIDRIEPTQGYRGQQFTIYGKRFFAAQGTGKVYFSEVSNATVIEWHDTYIIAQVPTYLPSLPYMVFVRNTDCESAQAGIPSDRPKSNYMPFRIL